MATIPTLAGIFPLWLAVTLHEGSTLLVALNSLRLLVDAPAPAAGSAPPRTLAEVGAGAGGVVGPAARPISEDRTVSWDSSVPGLEAAQRAPSSTFSSSGASSNGDEAAPSKAGSAEGASGGGSEAPAAAGAPRSGVVASAVPAAPRDPCHEKHHRDCYLCTPFSLTARPVPRGGRCSHCDRRL